MCFGHASAGRRTREPSQRRGPEETATRARRAMRSRVQVQGAACATRPFDGCDTCRLRGGAMRSERYTDGALAGPGAGAVPADVGAGRWRSYVPSLRLHVRGPNALPARPSEMEQCCAVLDGTPCPQRLAFHPYGAADGISNGRYRLPRVVHSVARSDEDQTTATRWSSASLSPLDVPMKRRRARCGHALSRLMAHCRR